MRRSTFNTEQVARADGPVIAFFRLYPLQDLLLIGYLFIVLGLVLKRPSTAATQHCSDLLYLSLVGVLLGGFASRSGLIDSRRARGVVYRVSVLGVLLANYLMLRDVLPVVRPDSVDAALYQVDLRLFGVEPSLWLERFNQHAIIEWFAFFYFSYFSIAIIYMVAVIWLRRADQSTTVLAIGTILVFCGGQLGYIAVPGFGPGKFLAAEFHSPIQGGFFWSCVMHVVSAGSAMKDIFPSLHTAAPTLFTWFTVGLARKDPRWRIPAILIGFFAANIIISTMLLRWHYAIDVVAGLILGSAAGWAAPRIAAFEARERIAAGMKEPWDFES